jgi:hypothetical protein
MAKEDSRALRLGQAMESIAMEERHITRMRACLEEAQARDWPDDVARASELLGLSEANIRRLESVIAGLTPTAEPENPD